MKNIIKQKCLYIVIVLFLITCALTWFSHNQYQSSQKLIEEVEYYDSLNRYNKIYYSKAFSSLRKENEELYDSLKKYKDKLDYVIQFSHEKEYNTGKKNQKPKIIHDSIHDTITIKEPLVSKTYQYISEPNDTFQYKLNVNSYTEPNWYSIQAKVKNKFTIVNKEENGMNHVTIGSGNGGNISDVTVWKKDKETFWKKINVGLGVTAGYDAINQQFGVMVGPTVNIRIK